MESLSWIFFCLTPFGFFCTENGTGLITGTVFLILGFVFKWLGNNSGGEPTAKVKVEPQKFWECHYMDSINGGGIDQNARTWATTVARAHNCPIPSEAEQERIARRNGIVTEKMKQQEKDKWDRIQVGKCYLMQELEKKYKNNFAQKIDENNSNKNRRMAYPSLYIEASTRALQFDDIGTNYVAGYNTFHRFKKNVDEMWNTELSFNEKVEAKKWVEEYENRMLKEINDYIEKGIPMPTITEHYNGRAAIYREEFDRKYGFIK